MWLKRTVAVVSLANVLGACGKPSASESVSGLHAEKSDDAKRSIFNLADFVTSSPYTEGLKPFVKNGDLVLGDMEKIGIRTNAKVETTGKSNLTPNGTRNISAEYYLNGAVYPHIIKIKEQSIVDIAARAGFDIEGVEGHVRILGDDKFDFSKKAQVEQKFVRDLKLKYPIIIGLEATASIGGEIGFEADVGIRKDDALSLHFRPVMGVNASAGAEANALRLISAEIRGIITILETMVATSASVGYLPDFDFSYGDISMDTTEIKALDGKVKFIAKAGLDSLLPENFQSIWKKISDFTGFNLGFTWEHVVWDPKPLFFTKIPARGVFFTSDLGDFHGSDCTEIRNALYAAADIMEAEKKSAEGIDADIAMSAEANIYRAAESVQKTCR